MVIKYTQKGQKHKSQQSSSKVDSQLENRMGKYFIHNSNKHIGFLSINQSCCRPYAVKAIILYQEVFKKLNQMERHAMF